MISAEGFENFLETILRATAVYMWGADVEIGTKELLELKKTLFGEEHYRDLCVKDIEGRICADCSGLFAPISGYDDTAHGYYEKCVGKGRIGQMPRNKKCLLFREQNGRVVHMAGYLGNGYLIEMWDGCEKKEFVASEWTYYGFPEWLEQQPDELVVGGTVFVADAINIYNNAYNAKNGKSALPFTYPSGEYYIYKIHKPTGAVNITKKKGVAGAWVILP